jgi:hypothetical protein
LTPSSGKSCLNIRPNLSRFKPAGLCFARSALQ